MGHCRRYEIMTLKSEFGWNISILILQLKIWSIAISLHYVTWWFERIYKIWKMSQIMCTTKTIVVANWPASAPMENHVSATSEFKWHLQSTPCMQSWHFLISLTKQTNRDLCSLSFVVYVYIFVILSPSYVLYTTPTTLPFRWTVYYLFYFQFVVFFVHWFHS